MDARKTGWDGLWIGLAILLAGNDIGDAIRDAAVMLVDYLRAAR